MRHKKGVSPALVTIVLVLVAFTATSLAAAFLFDSIAYAKVGKKSRRRHYIKRLYR